MNQSWGVFHLYERKADHSIRESDVRVFEKTLPILRRNETE